MTATHTQSTNRYWANAFAQSAKEFPLTPLPVLTGKIPPGLRGTLYRNGPGRLERGGERVGHLADGDGAILAVHFTDAGATGVYRYVKTKEYKEEAEAGEFLYGGYGMTAPGPIWNQWLRPLKNTANTAVLALPDKLLALWEAGKPYALDLQTLQTRGEDDLGGLDDEFTYSGHPKCDPQTGDIFNFGIIPGKDTKLNLYRSDRTGNIVQKGAIVLDGFPLLHDFILAGPYLIFCIPPVRVNPLPVLAGLSSFSESLTWEPVKGTQIIVLDRETFSLIGFGETEPWFQWHFGNGCVNADGSVILDIVRYRDFPHLNEYLKEVITGEPHTPAKGTLWQMRLNPQTGLVTEMQKVLDRDCEFPTVPPHQIGLPWRYTYLIAHRQGEDISQEIFTEIGRFDHQTGTFTEADPGENRYPNEPIYARDALNPERGWVLTLIYDASTHTSEIWVYDSERLDDEPVSRLGLPTVVPFGFHGTWKPA